MRLRLARICGTGDVLAEHAAFRCQRPEFFDVVNRGTAVSFALLDDPQLHHLVICLISRQADTILFPFKYLSLCRPSFTLLQRRPTCGALQPAGTAGICF